MFTFQGTETALLCAGIARDCKLDTMTPDIILMIAKYVDGIFSDLWDKHHDDLYCMDDPRKKIRSTNNGNWYNTGEIKYAFGKRVISIDPEKRKHIKSVWRLKLSSKHKRNHVCCGIGIIQKKLCESLLRCTFQQFSSNHQVHPKSKSLVGYQCGTIDRILECWQRNEQPIGHAIGDTDEGIGVYIEDDDIKLLTTSKYCFMGGDIATLLIDLKKMKLNIFVNSRLSTPKYSKSIRHIEKGEYCLGVWLFCNKHSIKIL